MIGPIGMVVAGGRSRRFGADKATALLGGKTLLERACARLTSGCAMVTVNAPADSGAAMEAQRIGVPLVSDAPGLAQGPLNGVAAGLAFAQTAGADLLLTTPCDTPFLPDDLILRLIAAAQDRSCAVARSPDGIQSLCAAWRPQLLPDLLIRLREGEHPAVHDFLEAQGCVFVDYPDGAAFLNINTQVELAAAEATFHKYHAL